MNLLLVIRYQLQIQRLSIIMKKEWIITILLLLLFSSVILLLSSSFITLDCYYYHHNYDHNDKQVVNDNNYHNNRMTIMMISYVEAFTSSKSSSHRSRRYHSSTSSTHFRNNDNKKTSLSLFHRHHNNMKSSIIRSNTNSNKNNNHGNNNNNNNNIPPTSGNGCGNHFHEDDDDGKCNWNQLIFPFITLLNDNDDNIVSKEKITNKNDSIYNDILLCSIENNSTAVDDSVISNNNETNKRIVITLNRDNNTSKIYTNLMDDVTLSLEKELFVETKNDDNIEISITPMSNPQLSMIRGGGGNEGGGGGSAVRKRGIPPSSISPLETAVVYWKNIITTTISKTVEPFQSIGKVWNNNQIKMKKMNDNNDDDIWIEQLHTIPIKKVIIPNTKVLSDNVILIAAKRSLLLNNPLSNQNVQDFAKYIQRWYDMNGYIYHHVIGASLNPNTYTAEIDVYEPSVSNIPVNITFVKEMIIDPDTSNNQLLTLHQYKEKYINNNNKKTFGFYDRTNSNSNNNKIDTSQLNKTYIETNGRIIPYRIANALQLQSGKPFRLNEKKWNRIKSCGIFKKILYANPKTINNDNNIDNNSDVQFHIVAIEAPTKHLEYGVSKSLYNNNIWEGEIDFEHTNVFGGGETIGINIKRQATTGTSSPKETNNKKKKKKTSHTTNNKNNIFSFRKLKQSMSHQQPIIDNDDENLLEDTTIDVDMTQNDDTTAIMTTASSSTAGGTNIIQPSIRIKYSDGRLLTEGGYDVELFREYIGTNTKHNYSQKNDNNNNKITNELPITTTNVEETDSSSTNQIMDDNTDDNVPFTNENEIDGQSILNQHTFEARQRQRNEANMMEDDVLVDRKGATIRIKNPIDPHVITNSVASASLEQTSTLSGINNEAIASTTWDLGPFYKSLPLDAKSNFDVSITAGTRISKRHQQHEYDNDELQYQESDDSILNQPKLSNNNEVTDRKTNRWLMFRRGGFIGTPLEYSTEPSKTQVLPYSSITATTRQIFPILGGPSSFVSSSIERQRYRRPFLLAFRHTMIASTNNIPQHLMQAHGTASTIRGSSDDNNNNNNSNEVREVTSSLQGTVEFRVPVQIPTIRWIRPLSNSTTTSGNRWGHIEMINPNDEMITQDGSVVVFTDWVIATGGSTMSSTSDIQHKQQNGIFHHQSSIGLGLRKSIQGLPIQYNVCYLQKEKTIKQSFGFGRDFDF